MRSCSTSPARRARRAGGAPSADWRGLGIPPRPWRAFTFIAPRRLSCEPLTRARVRLLGPCFKTGRVGGRHRRRPRALASLRGVAPCRKPPGPDGATSPGAHWGQSAPPLRAPRRRGREGWGSGRAVGGAARPPRNTGAPPRGWNPTPNPRGKRGGEAPRGGERREGGERGDGSGSLGPGIRRALLPGGCNTRGGWAPRPPKRAGAPPEPPSPPGLPSRPGAGRGAPPRRKCARRRPVAGRGAVPRRPHPRPRPPPPNAPGPEGPGERGGRVEGSGGTGRGKDPPGPPARPDHAAGLNPPGGLRGPHPFTS